MLVDVYESTFDACLWSNNTFVRYNRIADGTEDYKEFKLDDQPKGDHDGKKDDHDGDNDHKGGL